MSICKSDVCAHFDKQLCGASPQGGVGSQSGGLDLTVLHVNDIHVRIDETNKWSGTCKQKDKGQSKSI